MNVDRKVTRSKSSGGVEGGDAIIFCGNDGTCAYLLARYPESRGPIGPMSMHVVRATDSAATTTSRGDKRRRRKQRRLLMLMALKLILKKCILARNS